MTLAGKVIVFSGTLSMKRADAKKQAEVAGATVGSGVTGKTNILVAASGISPFQQRLTPAMQAYLLRFLSMFVWSRCCRQENFRRPGVYPVYVAYPCTIVTFLFALL